METNMHGVKVGMLTGLLPAWQDKKSQWHWLFECECGTLKVVNAVNVRNGQTKSCGCARGFFANSETSRAKMRAAKLGRKISREHVQKVVEGIRKTRSAVGYIDPRLGRPSHMKGKKRPELAGANNPRWIPNRTLVLEKHRVRGSIEWKRWREAVFARDNFTCKECGTTRVYVEPHHIIPVRSDWTKLFDLNNGITLCRPCHQKTVFREEEFAGRYTQLLTKAQ